MRYLIILSLLMVVLASSCDEDSFSQTVDIPIPEHAPLPAITVDVRSGDTALYHRLALSRGVLDNDDLTPRNMQVEVFKNDVLLAEQRFQSNSSNGETNAIELPTPITDEAATYRVVANVEGFDPVEVTQEMPSRPEYSIVSYEPDGALNSEGFRADELEIDIVDNPDTEDYYGFRVRLPATRCDYDEQRDTVICTADLSFSYDSYMDSPDPLLSMSSGFGFVVTDQSFNGSTYRIRLNFEKYNDADPILEVYHLTEDAYRYGVSRRAYENAGDNPFAEPVNVHQNVTNGYGYFIVSNRVVQVL